MNAPDTRPNDASEDAPTLHSVRGDALAAISLARWTTLADASSAFDRAKSRVALLCDDAGKPVASFGDAELREAALRQLAPSDPVERVANRGLEIVSGDETEDATRSRLAASGREVCVLVDGDGRPREARVLVSPPPRSRLLALVLAGGLGTRMGALASETPKPLVPVAGKPMIDHVLRHLARNAVSDVVLATNHKAQQIEDYLGCGARYGIAVSYLREEKRLGTAGALTLLDPAPDRPFLVVNADVLTRLDLREMERRHRASGAALTMAVAPFGVEVPFGVTRIVGTRVVQIAEKPRFVHWSNAGLYVVSPSLLADVPRNSYVDMTTLIDRFVSRGDPVEAFPVREYWRDAGTPEDVERASREISAL